MTAFRRSAALGTLLLSAAALAACGGGSSSAPSGTSTATSTSTAGGDAPAPFTYGYSVPTGQNPWINSIAASAGSTADAAGGTMELTDAQLDPAKAVQQINRFIADGVSSITVAPAQVPEALQGPLADALAQGIHTFGLEWSFASDPTAPPAAPVEGQVNVDRGKLGADVAAAVDEGANGEANVIYVGLPFPVASLDFFEASLEASLGSSSKILANLDNPTDNAQGALGPLTGALAANPEANAIVTYNGPSALAAVRAVEAAGMEDQVKIYDIQLDSATAKAIEDGTIAAAWDLNPPALGKALGELIAGASTGKPKDEWAKTVVIEAPMYTEENIADWKDWAAS